MKKIKFKSSILAVVLALTTVACDDYLDINQNPNNNRYDNVTPPQILAGAAVSAYRVQARNMTVLGNYFMQNWYNNIYGYTGVSGAMDYTYEIDNTFNAAIWDGLYPQIKNLNDIVEYSSEDYDNHKAAALILKAFYMQYIVDLYGDAPYSEAFQGGLEISPAYDDDAQIYASLIGDINTAFDLFDNTDSSDAAFGSEDVIFAGDVDKWKAFGNFVKAKLLLRESNVADAAFLSEQFGQITASGLFPTEAILINPGYNDATDAQLNPYYNLWYTAAGTSVRPTTYYVASGFIADFLNGQTTSYNGPSTGFVYSNIVDQRRSVLYELNGGVVTAAYQGQGVGDPGLPATISAAELVPGLGTDGSDGYVVSLPEIKFLLAEAISRGYLSGDAKTEFENGVIASFTQLGLSSATATSYLASVNSLPNVGWNGGANAISSIMTQKWLATNSINPIEAYIDLTRTGYPSLPLPTSTVRSHRPYRLQYPSSEVTANSANMPIVELSDLFTVNAHTPFWKN